MSRSTRDWRLFGVRSIRVLALIFIDRNGNGVIDTSGGYGDVLPWPGGGVSNAADECILHYVKVKASRTRHLSIDA